MKFKADETEGNALVTVTEEILGISQAVRWEAVVLGSA